MHTEGLAADSPSRPRSSRSSGTRCATRLLRRRATTRGRVLPRRRRRRGSGRRRPPRVDENLSAGKSRMFARTEFDRYVRGRADLGDTPRAHRPAGAGCSCGEVLGDGAASANVRIEVTERAASRPRRPARISRLGKVRDWPADTSCSRLASRGRTDARDGGDERHRRSGEAHSRAASVPMRRPAAVVRSASHAPIAAALLPIRPTRCCRGCGWKVVLLLTKEAPRS